jgi:hypothetical protein
MEQRKSPIRGRLSVVEVPTNQFVDRQEAALMIVIKRGQNWSITRDDSQAGFHHISVISLVVVDARALQRTNSNKTAKSLAGARI